ncbi:type IX secretion system sortase PorU [Flammeovirga pacifica]|uniref:Gingipain domain-containing protein n=1 Tax=Flammeovirga pacifica TaxID=915059 RepID=A0A1S1Z3D4_FLAPC|nr:type IX secretion system sortase PorU [Flammeovirga pacifica]OHX67751.1 hypothetical protein NH26_16075 [Flammeovirga pacifica]
MTSIKTYIHFYLLLFIPYFTSFGQSPLANGDVYKLEVVDNAIYKIDLSFLSEIGINTSTIKPNQVYLYGFVGGMLPQKNADQRPDQLLEVPMKFVGDNTNTFSQNDYFLFYGEGPNKIIIDSLEKFVDQELNLYSQTNNYYLVIKNEGTPLRIELNSVSGVNSEQFDQLISSYHHEIESVKGLSEPSGRFWFGENLSTTNSNEIVFDVLPQSTPSKIRIKAGVMAKSREISTFQFSSNGVARGEISVPSAPSFNSYRYGNQGHMVNELFDSYSNNSLGDNITINVNFNKPLSDSEGYLDYITLNVSNDLKQVNGGLLLFGFFENTTTDLASIKNNGLLEIWDITNKQNIYQLNNNNSRSSLRKTNNYFSVIAFNREDIKSPLFQEKIPNQDLRNISVPDLLIVTAPDYRQQANQLKNHRETNDNLDVHVVTTTEVFNEFSSGRQDITAIRDFAKSLYDRNNQKFKYLLLFGQGSYDYIGQNFSNSSQVPIYESRNVLMRTQTFSSEDFFGFFDDNEGFWGENVDGNVELHDLEIGVGRLPVRDIETAQVLVNKLIDYDTITSNREQWKKDILFVADDGDSNTHQRDANKLAVIVEENNSNFNSKRIYIDNLPKEPSPIGAIAPATYDLVYKTINDEGALIVNYSGHGSVARWADETILDLEMINNFRNYQKLPMFFTATCEFGRYDNPNFISAAEQLLFNPYGGAIAMMTTTRPVYASSNFIINNAFYDNVFQKNQDGEYPRLGDVLKSTKNASIQGVNNRNFALLGDPSMRLFIPENEVVITELNGNLLSQTDTIKALDRVRLKGEILNQSSRNSSFNGELFITLYEKPTLSSTRGNDGSETVFEYDERKFQLFRGVSNIVNGEFELDFVVPLDIRYNFDRAKLSLYAKEENLDEAIGSEMNIIIGGTSDQPVIDNNPPEISLSLNGDSTIRNTYPDFYLHAKLYDDSGINISGIGVGHDAMLILDDGDTSWVVNDYIQPISNKKNTYSLVFPVNDLSEGEHTLDLIVWDALNNRSEKRISFYVSYINEIEIEELKAYPNPVNDQFTLSFRHNLGGKDIKVQSNLIEMSGRIVLKNEFFYENSDDIISLNYQGIKSEIGLNKGVYVIQLIIDSPNLGLQSVKTIRIIVI